MRSLWMWVKKWWTDDLAELRRQSPSLLHFLLGFLPRRVWIVESPWGNGPGLETPEQVVEFVDAERDFYDSYAISEEEREEFGKVPAFTPAEVKRLWWPGARIERNGWSVECGLVARGLYGTHEWDGW